jgi:hypothetical protein
MLYALGWEFGAGNTIELQVWVAFHSVSLNCMVEVRETTGLKSSRSPSFVQEMSTASKT